MKKIIIILLMVFVVNSLVLGKTITNVTLGLKKSTEGQNIRIGDTVVIRCSFDIDDIGDFDSIEGVSIGPTVPEQFKLTIYWYTGYDGGGSANGTNNITVNSFLDPFGFSTGTNVDELSFTLPTPPANTLSLRIYANIFGFDFDFIEYVGSTFVYSTNSASGYYEYLNIVSIIEIKLGTENEQILIPISINWENIILTYDKSDIKIYIDNVLIDTKTIGDISNNYSSQGLFIGSRKSGGGNTENRFIGSMDEVTIFKKVLTAEDRAIIIGGGTMKTVGDCREISDLKAYWRFEEKAGTTVTDWAK